MQIKDLIPWAKQETDQREAGGHPLAEFQREMNRMFDSFWSGRPGLLSGPDFEAPLWRTGAMQSDVVETDEAVEVTIELPGIDEKDIDLTLGPGVLTVKGEKKIERKDEKKGYHLSERRYGSFQRVIGLPDGVDREAASAEFRNGVLKVVLPKLPEARAQLRKIDIKSA